MTCTCQKGSSLASELDPELLEIDPEIPDDREWSDAELDYSIVISPTSPGDGRFRVAAGTRRPSSLRFPFNTICFLQMRSGTSLFTGTGTLVAPRVVLTCKHNLMDLSGSTNPRCRPAATSGRVRTAVTITPGADLSAAQAPHRRPARPGSQTVGGAAIRVHPNLDLGLILLPQPFVAPGRFMTIRAFPNSAMSRPMTVAGYPCDKAVGTMWAHTEPTTVANLSASHLFYTMDTCPGHSGSPLWMTSRGARCLVGVHTTGTTSQAGSRCQNNAGRTRCVRVGGTAAPLAVRGDNCGVRITPAVVNWIRNTCQAARIAAPRGMR